MLTSRILNFFSLVTIILQSKRNDDGGVEFVISLIDLSFALMAIPNMISVIYLSKIVKQEFEKINS